MVHWSWSKNRACYRLSCRIKTTSLSVCESLTKNYCSNFSTACRILSFFSLPKYDPVDNCNAISTRATCGSDLERICVHGSDSRQSAPREIFSFSLERCH